MTMRNVWGRGFSLGAITSERQVVLRNDLVLPHSYLDALMAVLNESRAQGVDVAPYQAQLDELRAALIRLDERVDVLETDDDVNAWYAERQRLEDAVGALVATARAEIRAMQRSSKVTIGIWVGATVLGVVGTVLLVRWYGKKRRR